MLIKSLIENASPGAGTPGARDLYALLLEPCPDRDGRLESRRFLQEQLERARRLPHDFPADPQGLPSWMERKTLDTGKLYAEYLEGRRQGAPRLYFSTRAHALSFLRQAAPTKLVDGAWLYGILPYWKDARFDGLVRTYLEELGDGVPDQNHVVLYKRLLAENGCDILPPLSEAHYARGALQLAFACNAEQFLPELIGYNLGYEQLPLHLLITAFELGELDIDPYYFTLHVTIDNAGTGHARRAVDAVKACMPASGDSAAFWRRVIHGYQLNDLGLETQEIIGGFDLERELVEMLERKRLFGRHMHSDYSLIGGRTVNEWLSAPGQMRGLLATLEAKGWIVRHQDPRLSRFWSLIEGPKAPMAGVFDGFERQLLYDWISGEAGFATAPSRRKVFRRYQGAESGLERRELGAPDDIGREANVLRRELLSMSDSERMRHLIEYMHPARHSTPAGLYATREFAATLNRRPS